MDDPIFLLGALVTATVQSAAFWIMCWKRGVLSAFGCTPLSAQSLVCLTVVACMPFFCVMPLMFLSDSIFSISPEIEAAVLITAINALGLELTKRIGRRIVVESC